MWIDEFRIKSGVAKNKFKGYVFDALVWLLSKLDAGKLKKCIIDNKVEFEMSHYIPDDNKWHQFAYTVDFWVKVKGEEKQAIAAPFVYVDGEFKDKSCKFEG